MRRGVRRMAAAWIVGLLTGTALLEGTAVGREWVDATGKFKIEAELVSVEEGKALLAKPDGTRVAIPLEKLSEADREFLKKTVPANPFEAVPKDPADPFGPAADSEKPDMAKPDSAKPGAKGFPKLVGPKGDKPGEVRRFPDQGWAVKSLAFSPDGTILASGKMDRQLHLYDVAEENRIYANDKLENLDSVTPVRFTPDGKRLLTGGRSGEIVIWEVTSNKQLKQIGQFVGHTQEVIGLAISPDGKLAVSGGEDKRMRIWNIEDGREIRSFAGFEGEVKACFVSKDNATAYATDGSAMLIVNLRDKSPEPRQAKLNGSWAAGQFAAFSPDGLTVAAGDGYDVRLWNLKTGKELPKLEDRDIQWSGAFTPDGGRLVTGASGKLNVWDIKSQRRIAVVPTAGTGYIQTLAVSPDGLHVAAIPSSAGQTLQILKIVKN